MVDTSRIRNGLAVIASDGEPVGAVDALEGDRIKLTRKDSTDSEHHYIPLAWIDRIEERIHLNRTGAEVRTAWGRNTGAFGGGRATASATRRTNWLAWILIGLGLLALLWALSRCEREGEPTTATTTTTTESTAPATTEPATTPPETE